MQSRSIGTNLVARFDIAGEVIRIFENRCFSADQSQHNFLVARHKSNGREIFIFAVKFDQQPIGLNFSKNPIRQRLKAARTGRIGRCCCPDRNARQLRCQGLCWR